MTKRPSSTLRGRPSVPKGVWLQAEKTGYVLQEGQFVQRHSVRSAFKGVRVFVGPSVDGTDVEYIERVSGKVSNRKPSFAR